MQIYSHSRISCFEQCPLKYKLKYIDKIEAKTEETIEAFLGIRVHETLEKLYKDLQNQKENSLEELIEFYNREWKKNWNDSIEIVNKKYNQENYKKKGQKFITDYFNRYKPFNQEKTIGLEERIIIELDESGNYKLQGYIDRLTEKNDGFYEIHDYKTAGHLPTQKNLDKDRQLSVYAIGVFENYSDCQDVDLIWHYLAFDKEMKSKRSKDSLNRLKVETINLIDTIEKTEKFPSCSSFLCDWCEYEPICREWAHRYKLEDKPANIYLNDPGVKLVNAYAEIQNRKKNIIDEIDNQLEQIKEAIIEFCSKEKIVVVFGSNYKVKVNINERISYPSKSDDKREKLNQIIKNANKWDEVSDLDIYALSRKIKNDDWSQELINLIKEFQTVEKTKRLYLSKIKGKEK